MEIQGYCSKCSEVVQKDECVHFDCKHVFHLGCLDSQERLWHPPVLCPECLPSLGSRGHPTTCRKPCQYEHTDKNHSRVRGCKHGFLCNFCHLPHEEYGTDRDQRYTTEHPDLDDLHVPLVDGNGQQRKKISIRHLWVRHLAPLARQRGDTAYWYACEDSDHYSFFTAGAPCAVGDDLKIRRISNRRENDRIALIVGSEELVAQEGGGRGWRIGLGKQVLVCERGRQRALVRMGVSLRIGDRLIPCDEDERLWTKQTGPLSNIQCKILDSLIVSDASPLHNGLVDVVVNMGSRINVNSWTSIVIMGETGSGKSSLGNAMVAFAKGKSYCAFIESNSPDSETQYIDHFDAWPNRIIDTIGFNDTSMTWSRFTEKMRDLTDHAPSGVDVFLFVLRAGRFTSNDSKMFALLEDLFGDGVFAHVILVFSFGRESRLREDIDPLAYCRSSPNEHLRRVAWKVQGVVVVDSGSVVDNAVRRETGEMVFNEVYKLIRKNDLGKFDISEAKSTRLGPWRIHGCLSFLALSFLGLLVALGIPQITCDARSAPDNGTSGSCSLLFPFRTCQPECDEGYAASGPTRCFLGGIELASCNPLPCDASAAPEHGSLGNCSSRLESATVCQPSCDTGYVASGPSTCFLGQLEAATCKALPCDAQIPPQNGLPGNCSSELASSTTCQPTCNEGYEASGPTRCFLGKLESASCNPLACDASLAPEHGSLGNCTSRLESAAVCQPQCDTGYVASGPSTCFLGQLEAATCNALPNINEASEKDLQKVPGIGPDISRELVRRRPSRTWGDVAKVYLIGEKRLEALRTEFSILVIESCHEQFKTRIIEVQYDSGFYRWCSTHWARAQDRQTSELVSMHGKHYSDRSKAHEAAYWTLFKKMCEKGLLGLCDCAAAPRPPPDESNKNCLKEIFR